MPPRLPIRSICRQCLHARRQFSSSTPLQQKQPNLPKLPPTAGYAHLTSRALISVHGTDSLSFLQGLITQNLLAKDNQPLPNAAYYAAFLNANGRVLHDVFIYPPPEGGDSSTPKYLIEVDKEQVRTLMKHLKKYKLRAKLTLRALDEGEYSVWAAWDENSGTVGTKQDQAAQKSLPIACEDKRAPGFGSRIIAAGDFREKADYLPGQPVSLETYHLRRILHGIPEGQGEIVSGEALPLNCNMDIMGGVDFHKGCYVGQELTIRTHHRGVVQKRLLPVQLYNFNEQKPENETPVYDDEANLSVPRPHTPMTKVEVEGQAPGAAWRRPARPGTFICGIGNVGLATCGIEMMTDLALSDVAKQYDPDQEFQVTWTATSGNAEAVKVKAFIPPWTREYLLSRGARERTPVGEAQRAREIADEVESELQRYEGSDKQ